MALENVKAALKKDAEWRRYRSIRQDIDDAFPLESLQQELERIIKLRKVRTPSFKGVSPNRLLDMSMDEVQHRARLTEILIQAKRQYALLDALLDAMFSHVKGEYGDLLVADGLKAQADKNSAVTRLLSRGYATLSNIGSIMETAELIIKDIDQSSYTLTRVANMIELTTRREHVASINV